jgi:hypothetical protein
MSVRQNVFQQSVFRQSVFRQNVRPPIHAGQNIQLQAWRYPDILPKMVKWRLNDQ